MEALTTTVASVITLITTSMSSIATALMANQIFQLVIGVVVFGLSIGVIYTLVRKLKRKGN